MRHHQTPPPVHHLHPSALHHARPLQVDEQPGDEAAPEPTGDVRHLVPPPDVLRLLRHHGIPPRLLIVCVCAVGRSQPHPLPRQMCGARSSRQLVQSYDDRSLQGQHRWDEVLAFTQGECYLVPLQELEVLLVQGARKTCRVSEDEGDVGLLEDAVVYKGLPLWNSDDLGQHVGQPDWVYEVKVAQPF